MKSKLFSYQKRIAAREKRAGDKKRSTNVSSSSITETAKYEKEIAATINAVVKVLQLSAPGSDRGEDFCFPANGINIDIRAALTSDAAMNQMFDHNRDPI